MRVQLEKFGKILSSRPVGKEAWLVAQAYNLSEVKEGEKIEVDFSGIQVLTPSWADEFITPLKSKFPGRVVLLPSDNPTVKAALGILQEK